MDKGATIEGKARLNGQPYTLGILKRFARCGARRPAAALTGQAACGRRLRAMSRQRHLNRPAPRAEQLRDAG